MAGKTTQERLEAAVSRKQLLQVQIEELEAKVADAKRRADTHRKIVLGALVLKDATAAPGRARDVVRDAVRTMSRREKDAFAGIELDWLDDLVRVHSSTDLVRSQAQVRATTFLGSRACLPAWTTVGFRPLAGWQSELPGGPRPGEAAGAGSGLRVITNTGESDG